MSEIKGVHLDPNLPLVDSYLTLPECFANATYARKSKDKMEALIKFRDFLIDNHSSVDMKDYHAMMALLLFRIHSFTYSEADSIQYYIKEVEELKKRLGSNPDILIEDTKKDHETIKALNDSRIELKKALRLFERFENILVDISHARDSDPHPMNRLFQLLSNEVRPWMDNQGKRVSPLLGAATWMLVDPRKVQADPRNTEPSKVTHSRIDAFKKISDILADTSNEDIPFVLKAIGEIWR